MAIDYKTVLSPYIKSLLLTPPNLTPDNLATVIKLIVQGVPTDIQTAAFLTALRVRGLDHQPEYIAAAAKAVLEFSVLVDPARVDALGYIDVVGTGGDGQNTFNVSTSAAIVAAGMGLNVCKHGGKALTSSSGAGDLMTHLGVSIAKVTAATTPAIVARLNFCFLFAPAFHPGMGKVAPLRAGLGIPTIFNVLGPLMNPIPLRARIIGVYSEHLGQVFAEAACEMDAARGCPGHTMVVWGECGLDEIAPIGRTKVWATTSSGEITVSYIEPADFGLPEHSLSLVASGTPQENAQALLKILGNDAAYADGHPLVDYIVMNAAALSVVGGIADSWSSGVVLARESIRSGAALAALQTFIQAVAEIEE
ncbi:hypothetical protein BABINDRAFT_162961 [Babjeviella inositovora NRRL Y-12698]|uniref:Anthranilate phosphoribosyltransferase n=1 Tax=Babjeviella inositovora NRRL Y-12698 TaxID=984486 RepID=A0A1E3QKU3_9ASCO|nr:uncharacterized protein BABINDRAFT_162961 [Babjeviella inositovora NRRL Y-12698]ODQ78319.1 hypothetical protein BABINDRAFT_162961 [Babjeviella inositovora NRRL Y-12698]